MSTKDLERIYESHFAVVFRYVVGAVGRRDIAEEITAEAFLRLLDQRGKVDESRLPAWLITVAKNLVVDHWRATARERCLEDQPEPSVPAAETDPAGLLISHPDLKPVHRACLILRYVHGMDRTEIAQYTGMTDNQVKSCLQYGLQLLRRTLVKE
jgi:RNA polymerase sigma-70 factor, ECF subfamily